MKKKQWERRETRRTAEEIRIKLNEIESDARLHYKTALVEINAPLALIQTDLAAKADALRWVLGLPNRQAVIEKPKRLARKAQTPKRTK